MSDISTWDALRAFGFKKVDNKLSSPPGGLSVQLNGIKLDGIVGLRLWDGGPMIMFTGIYSTARELIEVQIDLPMKAESSEYVAALLVCLLDDQLGSGYETASTLPWIEIGRRNLNLLPWVRSQAAYEIRPRCEVDREWMKLAIKELRSALGAAGPDESVRFGFDGKILRIETRQKLIPVAGHGQAWAIEVSVQAERLRKLPKRLMQPSIEVSYFDDRLHLANWRYPAKEVKPPVESPREAAFDVDPG